MNGTTPNGRRKARGAINYHDSDRDEPAQMTTANPTTSTQQSETDASPKSGAGPRYTAALTGGSLKVAESRVVAGLLLRHAGRQEMGKAILTNNALKARTPATARRLGRLIRDRLAPMPPEILTLIRDGSGDVATHATLAAAIKHSRLLGDFMDLVLRDHYRRFTKALNNKLWDDYLDECRGRDPEMPQWTESTSCRLRSSVFQILAQAGFLENTRSLTLRRPHIAAQVLASLQHHHEDYVLRCITVGS